MRESIKNVCEFLKIDTIFLNSEDIKIGKDYKKQAKILEICSRLDCKSYYNLPGGRCLYDEKDFLKKNIDLKFIETKEINNYLSIFDLCLGEGLEKI